LKKLKTLSSLDDNRGKRYLNGKWVWFDSGFYEVAGIWTLIVIEVGELVGCLSNLVSFAGLGEISIISLIIEFLIDQLGNLLQAFLWWGKLAGTHSLNPWSKKSPCSAASLTLPQNNPS
jgi:hypothetical protein